MGMSFGRDVWRPLAGLMLVAGVLACGGDDDDDPIVPPVPDVTPPGAITDLRNSVVSTRSIMLIWTAPGDDGDVGTVTDYDIRYSTAQITETNWSTMPRFPFDELASPVGFTERVTVGGLNPNTTYYFVVSALDEEEQRSPLSNVHQVSTDPPVDVIAPSAVADLAIATIDSTSAVLTFTAPGNDGDVGTAAAYDLRYALFEIDEGNWLEAEIPIKGPIPRESGTTEFFPVPDLQPGTQYYFAMITLDGAGNKSQLSNLVTATTPALRPE